MGGSMSTFLVLLFALVCAWPALSQVLINEVLYDPEGTDTGKEKIEIRNVGSTTIDLTGYDLYPDGIGYFTFPAVSLAPGAIAVVHLRQSGSNSGSEFFHSTPSTNMGNASGSVALFSSTTHSAAALASFVQWGAGNKAWSSAAVTAGIWSVAADSVPAVPEGHSIEYDGAGFTPGDWFDQSVPTPGSTNSLPVQLVAFSARRNGATVVLMWETLTEVDNFGFDVERRTVSGFMLQDSGPETLNLKHETQWLRVGFVPGSGTTHSRQRYSFVDNVPLSERTAYRLRQLDRTGMFSFSDIVEIGPVGRSETMMIECYPNPFNPETAVSYRLSAFSDVRLSVFDVLGREAALLVEKEQEAGSYTVIWNATSMPSGTYFATLEIQGMRVSRKMLLLR